jgi:hypothetical protein
MTVHSQLKSIATVAVKLGAVALMVASLSACVIAPIGHGYRHHGHSGPVVVEAAPVVVTPPPAVVVRPSIRHGYPRYYRY